MTCGQFWKLILGVLEIEPKERTEPSRESAEGAEETEEAVAAAPSGPLFPLPATVEDSLQFARYLGSLEAAVRTLIPLAIRYDPTATELPDLPLTEESEFPLPGRFVSAAVYLTGFLMGGETRLYELYTAECDSIRGEIPGEIGPTVQAY